MEYNLKIPKPELWDKVQICINIIAFVILYVSMGGKGSFWQLFPLTFMIIVIFLETLMSPQKNNMWLWTIKVITYVILTIKFSSNIGVVRWYHIVMIIISLGSFIVSKKIIKTRKVALWGQNIAVGLAGLLYIQAVISHPESYKNYHIWFWILNVISYAIASIIVYRDDKKSNEDLIRSVFATIACTIYAIVVIIT